MRQLLIILMLFPMLGYAQRNEEQQIYLTSTGAITTQKSELKCVANDELSHGYTHTYDCNAADGKLVKQLSLDIHLAKTVNNNLYADYQKHQPEYGEYLLGEFKDGKPFNGFFRAPREKVNEWLMFDFYKNGALVSQLYNNLHKTIAGRDNRLNFITLDAEGNYVNGQLQKGIVITPLRIKKAAGEVVTFMDNFKPTYIMIDLYAENYGEFVKVAPANGGFMISNIANNKLKITYNAEGRTLEYFDSNNKLVNKINMVQAELLQTAGIDPKRPYTYFEKNGKIYKEQVKNPAALSDNHDFDLLGTVADALYNNGPLNTAAFIDVIENDRHQIGILGYHTMDDGKEFGYVYKKGSKENTYSLDLYKDGKVYKPSEYSIKDKTLSELITILKSKPID
jgi:hypothetical protein